jgi:DNA-binding transcriptional LysR family regulator
MNYNYLRYFSVLAQVEHYTLAAARLGISQPSLSSAINHLEDELGGIKLFEKVGRNIRLTEEGRFYQEKVDAALHELNSASMTLRSSKASAPVVIHMGVVSGALGSKVAGELAAYIRQDERIRLQLTESSAEELMDFVRQEKLDMAIVDTTNRDRSLHFRKLCQRDFCVAVPLGHPLAGREFALPNEIAQEPQVVFNYDIEKSFSHSDALHGILGIEVGADLIGIVFGHNCAAYHNAHLGSALAEETDGIGHGGNGGGHQGTQTDKTGVA